MEMTVVYAFCHVTPCIITKIVGMCCRKLLPPFQGRQKKITLKVEAGGFSETLVNF
jgi:hypothetical protein